MFAGIGLYVKNSVEAVALYQQAFGLTLGYHVRNADGSFFHSELCQGETQILSVVEAKRENPQDSLVEVGMVLDSEAEVRKAFELLSVGGVVDTPVGPLPWSPCAATLTDRFGVWWFLSTPMHRPDESFDPAAPLNGGE